MNFRMGGGYLLQNPNTLYDLQALAAQNEELHMDSKLRSTKSEVETLKVGWSGGGPGPVFRFVSFCPLCLKELIWKKRDGSWNMAFHMDLMIMVAVHIVVLPYMFIVYFGC